VPRLRSSLPDPPLKDLPANIAHYMLKFAIPRVDILERFNLSSDGHLSGSFIHDFEAYRIQRYRMP
jgi:hypothetical protein